MVPRGGIEPPTQVFSVLESRIKKPIRMHISEVTVYITVYKIVKI
jgi:hypothetical protein